MKKNTTQGNGRKLFNIIFSIFTIIFSTIMCSYSHGQTDLGTSFVTGKPGATTILRDYEAIGVNPANLGYDDNNRFSLGLGDINLNLQSRGLNFKNIDTSFIKKHKDNKNNFTVAQANQILKLVNNDGANLNTSVTLAALSLHLGRLGGISFSLRDRILTHFSNNKFTEATLDSLFNNKKLPPISTELNSTNISMEYLREINVAYGFKLPQLIPTLNIYAGIGYRYVIGLQYINLKSENYITTAESTINGSNYNEDFKTLMHVPLKSSDMFKGEGHGSAIDLGLNAVLLNKIRFGISVTNIGSVKWNSMQKAVADSAKINAIQKNIESFGDLFNQANLFKSVPGFKTSLPSEFRIGAGIKFTRFLEIGADIAKPLNNPDGYNSQTIMSAGVQLNIFRMIKFNTGISGNTNIGWNIPLGITLSSSGFYDIYFATNDILTYLNKTKNPMLSMAICAFRINLPPKKIKALKIL